MILGITIAYMAISMAALTIGLGFYLGEKGKTYNSRQMVPGNKRLIRQMKYTILFCWAWPLLILFGLLSRAKKRK